MTVTRLFQAGAELRNIGELDAYPGVTAYGITNAIVSSTKARTGAYSFGIDGNAIPRGKTFASSTTQIRAGVYLNHAGVSGALTTNNAVLWLVTGGSFDILIQWASDTSTFELVVNGTIQASISAASSGMSSTNTWYHLGINVKANTSTGWASFYVDGVQKLTWSGNTGSSLTGVYLGGRNTANTLSSGAYWDDFYVDDTVGEADGAVPSPRFPFLLPNGAGNYTNWAANTGSNYAAVDEDTIDDDTTYVYATTSGVKDSYALTNPVAGTTVPTGYSIDAVIPVAWARKTNASIAATLKVGMRLSSTDAVGSATALGTTYGSAGPVWDRQTAKPGGGQWAESDVDSAEVYLESAGTYS